MNVTMKCDVYSFGVVTLELLMGKHPGDLLTHLPSSTEVDAFLQDVLDLRIPNPTDQVAEEVSRAFSVALQCLEEDPRARPTMRQVADKLAAVLRSPETQRQHQI